MSNYILAAIFIIVMSCLCSCSSQGAVAIPKLEPGDSITISFDRAARYRVPNRDQEERDAK